MCPAHFIASQVCVKNYSAINSCWLWFQITTSHVQACTGSTGIPLSTRVKYGTLPVRIYSEYRYSYTGTRVPLSTRVRPVPSVPALHPLPPSSRRLPSLFLSWRANHHQQSTRVPCVVLNIEYATKNIAVVVAPCEQWRKCLCSSSVWRTPPSEVVGARIIASGTEDAPLAAVTRFAASALFAHNAAVASPPPSQHVSGGGGGGEQPGVKSPCRRQPRRSRRP